MPNSVNINYLVHLVSKFLALFCTDSTQWPQTTMIWIESHQICFFNPDYVSTEKTAWPTVIVGVTWVGYPSMRNDLSQENTKGPDIWLDAECTKVYCFWRGPLNGKFSTCERGKERHRGRKKDRKKEQKKQEGKRERNYFLCSVCFLLQCIVKFCSGLVLCEVLTQFSA